MNLSIPIGIHPYVCMSTCLLSGSTFTSNFMPVLCVVANLIQSQSIYILCIFVYMSIYLPICPTYYLPTYLSIYLYDYIILWRLSSSIYPIWPSHYIINSPSSLLPFLIHNSHFSFPSLSHPFPSSFHLIRALGHAVNFSTSLFHTISPSIYW